MTRILATRRVALGWLGAAAFVPLVARAAGRPPMTVHKDPNCSCCGGWVEHVRKAGFSVTVEETPDLAPVKARLGVPEELASCHTAEIAGYAIEGHVPAPMIERLLTERPKALGLAVPGMPPGSPGMGGAPEIYEVVLFGPQGRRIYGRFKGEREI